MNNKNAEWNPNGQHEIPQARIKLSRYDDDGEHHSDQTLESYVVENLINISSPLEEEARFYKMAECLGKLISVLTENKIIDESAIKRILSDEVSLS